MNATMFAGIAAIFIAISLYALTAYPAYYEDESWTFLPAFEALRGNGLTWAALSEGHSVAGTFNFMVLPFIALLPFEPEANVRLTAMIFGIACLTAAYALGRRWAPRAAALPPALMLITPVVFNAMRYGRLDVVALALALWSLALIAWQKPLASGVLSGLAVTVHPGYLWLAAPCLVFAYQQGGRAVARYVIGGLFGLIPQVLWVLLHYGEVRAIWDRYAVTSSVGTARGGGFGSSLTQESSRWRAYIEGLDTWQKLVQGISFIVLPLASIALLRPRKAMALGILALSLTPFIALALLFQAKSPYYLHGAIAALAVVAAIAAARMPVIVTGFAVVLIVLIASLSYVRAASDARELVTSPDVVAVLEMKLPQDAVVFAPLTHAGLIRRRDDITLYSYLALSDKPGWKLPECDRVTERIKQLLAADPRSQPPRNAQPQSVYFVMWEPAAEFNVYVRSIYADATPAAIECFAGAGSTTTKSNVCGSSPSNCLTLVIAERQLR